MAVSGNNKDTIYVDVDDEITTIIDKVRGSDGKIVALVLPKRATIFQSIVNMKLLKRNAEAAKKHVVLITTESSLMPLAGAVGLHVAATPQSKPEVPAGDDEASGNDEVIEESSDATSSEFSADTAGDRPIGELANAANTVPDEAETLSLPDEADEATGQVAQGKKSTKDRHLKVPNFNKFRLRLLLGGVLLILVIVGLYTALAVLPKATIVIATNTSTVNVNLNPTLDSAAQMLDTSQMVIPAKIEQQQKTTDQQVATTGQKNTGTVAAGSVTMSAGQCSGTVPADIPAGTGLTTNGLTFITQNDTGFGTSVSHGQCTWQAGATGIAAQNPGTKYNVSGATFSVAGRTDVSATGSASGGTDNIIQVVAQADIDSAKQKLSAQDTDSVKSGLEQTLRQDGMYPLPNTFNASTPTVTTSNNVDDQAANVTVTEAVTYTMYGAKQGDLETLIKSNINTQINTNDQTVLDDGLAAATINVANASGTKDQITLQTTATVGPDINVATIKTQTAGKKVGDVKALISNLPGVTNADVRLSPFWVSSVPTNTNKITITISGTAQAKHGG